MALGRHLIAELWVKEPRLLDDPDVVRDGLLAACRKGKFSIINLDVHVFSPYGVTGVALLAESHMSIHTWPEYGYAAVDIFTCGGEPWEALEEMERRLGVEHRDVREWIAAPWDRLSLGRQILLGIEQWIFPKDIR